MNPNDQNMFQQAMQMANTGQKAAAYAQLKVVQSNANEYDPDLLLWIAFTTPYLAEARQALDTVTSIAPEHPGLPAARVHYAQQQYPQQQYLQPYQQAYIAPLNIRLGPVLQCPYCHTQAPVRIDSKISTAGWVIFAVVLVFFFPLCWIGLLIKEDYRACSYCGAKFG
jgi:uncharacterized Zn-finger protein